MIFTALDIIHLWTDSRGKMIQQIFPTNGKICVFCTGDLSMEAAKVCNFINLIVQQPWTFQMKNENGKYVVTFFPETVSLGNLFPMQKTNQRATSQQKQGIQKTPRVKRETAGDDSNQLNLKCNL